MDNITRQNQFYETPVIKQENESGYDRRPLDMEPPQQAYRPGRKAPTLSSLMETESFCWAVLLAFVLQARWVYLFV